MQPSTACAHCRSKIWVWPSSTTTARLRTGFPEVVYCAGKTPEQVAAIVERLAARGPQVLGTRASVEQFEAARMARARPASTIPWRAASGWIANRISARQARRRHRGRRHQRSAGGRRGGADARADGPRAAPRGRRGRGRAASPAAPRAHACKQANVVVVVAGMEGALASVVGGLTDAPVIAVPTSVGYGASFGGLAALLAMLNSCASGVAVVNIDNGYGAGHMAALINSRIAKDRLMERQLDSGQRRCRSAGSIDRADAGHGGQAGQAARRSARAAARCWSPTPAASTARW